MMSKLVVGKHKDKWSIANGALHVWVKGCALYGYQKRGACRNLSNDESVLIIMGGVNL